MKTPKALTGLAVALLVTTSCNQASGPEERNRAVILKANEELFTKGNLQYADEAFTADYSFPGMDLKGPDLIRSYVAQIKKAFPDLQYTLEPTVAQGNLVAWSRTMTGTHSGDFMGYKATNKLISWKEYSISKFTNDGKIAEESGSDNLEVALQKAHGFEGTYEFLAPQKGQASLRNGRFEFVLGPADGSRPIRGEAGSYVVNDSMITSTYSHTTDPKGVGTSANWKVKSWSGDTITFTIFAAKGEVAFEGRALRVGN